MDNATLDFRGREDLPLGIRNNNPGNIRPGDPWTGKVGENAGFIVFRTLQLGIRALSMDLCNKYLKGYDTIREVLTRYAPTSENDTEKYIKSVAKSTGLDPNKPYELSQKTLTDLVLAICLHENGKIALTVIDRALVEGCFSMMPLKLYKLIK